MKRAACAALLPLILLSPLCAEDHQVPPAVLAQLRLGGMQAVPNERAMQVRGNGRRAHTRGLSIVSAVLFDPDSGSLVQGSDANLAQGFAEHVGRQLTQSQTQQESSVGLNLTVNAFSGVLIGGAGGRASARAR
jgi:opacity protein-like surface antigen